MKAISIAKWFVERANSEFVDEGGVAEGVTNLKLQKLLYFAQAASLSLRGEELFDDPIEAWKFGPVVPNVYHALKHYGNGVITKFPETDTEELDSEVAALLEDVWAVYGKFAAHELVNITHSQRPWRDVYMKGDETTSVISVDNLREYYRDYYKVA